MKQILIATLFFGSVLVSAQGIKLDETSVSLADLLLKPQIRECIDSALLANAVKNDSDGAFSIKEVETFTALEPLLPNSSSQDVQSVTHYVLKTRAYSKPEHSNAKMIRIVFDIKVSSGTGILDYSCSAQLQ